MKIGRQKERLEALEYGDRRLAERIGDRMEPNN